MPSAILPRALALRYRQMPAILKNTQSLLETFVLLPQERTIVALQKVGRRNGLAIQPGEKVDWRDFEFRKKIAHTSRIQFVIYPSQAPSNGPLSLLVKQIDLL